MDRFVPPPPDQASGEWVYLDHRGHHADKAHEHGSSDAILFVRAPTDAVKLRDTRNRLTGSMDKSRLSMVEGFGLRRHVLEALPDGPLTPAELIAAVSDAGLEWDVVEVGSAGSAPSS